MSLQAAAQHASLRSELARLRNAAPPYKPPSAAEQRSVVARHAQAWELLSAEPTSEFGAVVRAAQRYVSRQHRAGAPAERLFPLVTSINTACSMGEDACPTPLLDSLRSVGGERRTEYACLTGRGGIRLSR